METIKVSSTSCPNNVAGAIASMIRNESKLQIQVIGAAALNQAIKAIGNEIVCIPSFHDLIVDDKEITALRLLLELR